MPYDSLRRKRNLGAASDPGFPALKARIIARTGHHYYADKDDLLFDRLAKRFRTLSLPDAAAYAARLEGPDGAREWAELEAEITIGETFFFRYAEQFAALRDEILPALIAARADTRSLRIWSAGCASGAEPYSIAILLHALLGPALADWNLSILGTDLNSAALATARAAEYGRWALRTTDPADRLRWFERVPAKPGPTREGGFRLRPEYRAMVRFERHNLLTLVDGSAGRACADFDLVLCRNVLIYFSPENVAGIVRGFSERLRPGGWLLIGHAEPNPAFSAWLDPVALTGTVAYRRGGGPLAAAMPRPPEKPPVYPEPVFVALPPPPAPPARSAETALDARAAGRDPDPVMVALDPTVPDASSIEAVLSDIRSLADSGATGEGWRLVRETLVSHPTDAALRYYEGLLALGLGRETEAERAFRRAVFLQRDFVMAHFQLGLLLMRLDRPAPAARALGNARRLARGMRSETELAEGGGLSAGDVVANVGTALGALAGAAV